ncbi:MAG: hypothetical protein AAF570_07910, partial [Bacteroidota bacterium]
MRKPLFLLLFCWYCTTGFLFSQATFVRFRGGTGDEVAKRILPQSGGGVVMIGSTTSAGAGDEDYFWEMYNAAYTLTDSFTIGNGGRNTVHDALPLGDDVVLLGGSKSNLLSAPVVCSAMRINAAGNDVWQRVYYRYNNALNTGNLHGGVLSSDTLFLVGGLRALCNGCTNTDHGIFKVDTASGGMLGFYAQNFSTDVLYSVAASRSGNQIYTLGMVWVAPGVSMPQRQIFTVYDRNLNVVRDIEYVGVRAQESQMHVMPSDSITMLFRRSPPVNNTPVTNFLGRADSLGEPGWACSFAESTGDEVALLRFVQVADSFYFVGYVDRGTGSTLRDAFVMSSDTWGNVGWTRAYAGAADEQFNDILPAAGGGFLLVGSSASIGGGGDDVLFMRTDAAGQV